MQLWVIHRPLPGAFADRNPGYMQITGQPSEELALAHAQKMLAAGCRVDGIYDHTNHKIMGEAELTARFGLLTPNGISS